MTEKNNAEESVAVPVATKETPKAKSTSPEKAAADTKKAVSRKKTAGKNKIRTTASGHRVKLVPVAANALREAQARIPDPTMRTFTNPNDGKEQANPAHPEYIAELNAVKEERTKASMNVMVLFGMELLDPIPDDNGWLKKIKFAGLITQAEYDEAVGEEGEFLREMYFKNYIVGDFSLISTLASMSGITQEMIAQARDSFPGDA